MTGERLLGVGHGPAATAALADVLAGLKASDPLAPVTVAVPHPWAGLSLRRALARRPGGVVNVQFLVLARIAELLGAPALAARSLQPRTPTVARAAARAVLRTDPGTVLAPAAEHPATEAAVVRLVDDLAAIGDEGRRRLAAVGPRPADLVAVAERVLDAAPGRYDRHDLTRSAVEAVRRGDPAVTELGHLVVHLPWRLTSAELDLVAALAARGAVTVLLGATGHDTADLPTVHLRGRLEAILGPTVATAPGPGRVPVQRIITATDADDEVRAALRVVVGRWEEGLDLGRAAIAYPAAEPYARLLRERAAAAGIPVAAPPAATLASTVVGRTLLDGLAIADHGIERDAVIAWLSAAPIRTPDGRRAPVSRWDRLTRRAGIVDGGLAHWEHHLDAELSRIEQSAEHRRRADPTADPAVLAERTARDRALVEEVRQFITWLDESTRLLEAAGSWREMADSARSLLLTALGPEPSWRGWPDEQVEAGVAVLDALDRISALDEVEPHPRPATFRRALAAELDVAHGRTGRVGTGLLLVPLHHAVALDLDLLVVVGLAEGTLPGRTSDDALIPDADRVRAGADLPRRADAVQEQHHRLLAALAGATERVLSMPRGDLRQGRERLPSRWMLDAASDLVGRTVTTADFDAIVHPHIEPVPSFTAGLTAAAHHLSVEDRDLADLTAWVRDGRPLHHHPLTGEIPSFGRAVEVVRARRTGGFGRFTGHVTGVEIPTFRHGGALSPTALERWAACPRRYFFAQVLRLHAEERPEVIDRITARERGSLVHAALDRFLTEVIAAGPKTAAEPWSPTERSRAHELLDAVGAEFDDQGLTGRAVFWDLDRAALHRDLDRFLDDDDAMRARTGATPVAAELSFGPDEATQARLQLSEGRQVTFRGLADRVDRTDGNGLRVIDYKTGSASRDVRSIKTGDDKLVRGEKLQLPVYALAARSAFPDADGPIHAEYWHITASGGWDRYGYTLAPEHETAFVEVLTTIADGIESGVFPGRPGEPQSRVGSPPFKSCTYCDFDVICGRDRGVEWDRVRLDPRLRGVLTLAGELDDDPGADS